MPLSSATESWGWRPGACATASRRCCDGRTCIGGSRSESPRASSRSTSTWWSSTASGSRRSRTTSRARCASRWSGRPAFRCRTSTSSCRGYTGITASSRGAGAGRVDGQLLKQALLGSLAWLGAHQEEINRLNVFPVPDGDTGTNMLLPLQSAIEDVRESQASEVSKIARIAAHGSLMGARGNSGVILSQIFRGFASAVQDKVELSPAELATAFEEAANAAYRAVSKPTEGTILTVA